MTTIHCPRCRGRMFAEPELAGSYLPAELACLSCGHRTYPVRLGGQGAIYPYSREVIARLAELPDETRRALVERWRATGGQISYTRLAREHWVTASVAQRVIAQMQRDEATFESAVRQLVRTGERGGG